MILDQRNQLMTKLLDAEADKAMLAQEVLSLRRRVAALEAAIKPEAEHADSHRA